MCVVLKAYVCHLLRLVGVVFYGSRTHVHKTQKLSLYVHLLEIPLVLKWSLKLVMPENVKLVISKNVKLVIPKKM